MNSLAKAAVRRLRTGVVPEWELERLSVGYGPVKGIIGSSLRALSSDSPPRPLFIRGEWGSGKSHFLSYVRARASQGGIPSARVNLNARSAALNYPQRLYARAMGDIRLAEMAGLRPILMTHLMVPSNRATVRRFARSSAAGDLGWPLHLLCDRYDSEDLLDIGADPAWTPILGGDLVWADYPYKRNQAIARFGTIGRLVASSGLQGMCIMFDEAETIDQLWNIRSRIAAYGVMGALVRTKALWCLFGITERFERAIAIDLQRGILRMASITPAASSFLRAWEGQEYQIVEPPGIGSDAAATLAQSVAALYEEAHAIDRNDGVMERSVEEWRGNPSRNPRRLIRLLIHRLDVRRRLEASH
jgi:BREX system ATP-binding protein BrxC/D